MGGLTIQTVDESQVSVVVNERLWLTAERDRLVPDGDPDAAFLFCTAGARVARADALRLGLIAESDPVTVQAPPEPDQEPDVAVDAEGETGPGPGDADAEPEPEPEPAAPARRRTTRKAKE